MEYQNTTAAIFRKRLNRFTAEVELDGKTELVHVKNTGRCETLLLDGAEVTLQHSDNPDRKTRYDLISVNSPALGWVNIDSTAPNAVTAEWLKKGDYTLIKPEYRYGASRFDFYMERGDERFLLEVKGCTLVKEGRGYFPDAPTVRGVKHLTELSSAVSEGYSCAVAFVIPINGIREVRANRAIHSEFADALDNAKAAGVKVKFLLCEVSENSLRIVEEISAN